MHDARCWHPTVSELRRQAPDIPVVAVDLPGRGSRPDGLMTYSIAGCVQAIVDQVAAAELEEFVLVGHSAAGLVLPAVAEYLGANRVRHMVFVAAYVPPDGSNALDLMSSGVQRLVRRVARQNRPVRPLPPSVAGLMLCNGMTREQRRIASRRLCAEYPLLPMLCVRRAGMPGDIPRTWVLTMRDRALSPQRQRQAIEHLGGVQRVVEIDTGHNVMMSEPLRLAQTLLSVC